MAVWSKILNKAARAEPQRAVYEAIVAAARRPFLYAELGVPDTVLGRFDMIVLHAFLVLERVKDDEPAFSQALTDELFRDMDRSLREMGVGDISVGKKVRGLAEAFTGRVTAYGAAIEDRGRFKEALARNVWAETAVGDAARLADVAFGLRQALAAQSASEVARGRVNLT